MSTLFVSDLDGTLLDRQGGLSDVSRRALERLLDRGVPFTVASARSVISMQSVLLDLPIRLPVVCFNGGFVSELHTGRHLHVFPLAQDAAQGAHRMATARGLSVMVSTHTPQGDRLYVPTAHTPGIALYVAARQSFGDPRLRLVDDASVGLREDVTCLTAIAMRTN
nr:Cof-type HAD-IIB family hydrolase [Myxococcales bacterium]